MNKNRFLKEANSYFSIFISFIIIFVIFSSNTILAVPTCADIDEYNNFNHCRDWNSDPFTYPKDENENPVTDKDGNLPLTCNSPEINYFYLDGIELPGADNAEEYVNSSAIEDKFSIFKSEDYQYDTNNLTCLIWGIGLDISYNATAIAADAICTVSGINTAAATVASKIAKIRKLAKVVKTLKTLLANKKFLLTAGSKVAEKSVIGGVLGALSDPITSIKLQFLIDAGIFMGKILANGTIVAVAGVAAIVSAGISSAAAINALAMLTICAGSLAVLFASTIKLIVETTLPTYWLANSQINQVKVCGSDWLTYAYTSEDMNNPKIEWYPEYGSFSNSYSYKINKCIKYGAELAKSDYDIDCNDLKDGEQGFCDLSEEECKNVYIYSKNSKNRAYREYIYKGKEFKISTEYSSGKCTDPRLDSNKNYSGLEQRYYFRGKEPAEYACSRFNYDYKGCVLKDGTKITQKEAAEDSSKNLKCVQAFREAKSCCENRRKYGICIYTASGTQTSRDNNSLCVRGADGSAGNCSLILGGLVSDTLDDIQNTLGELGDVVDIDINISEALYPEANFVAYPGETDSTLTCIRSVDNCPFDYNVGAGTELQDLYCAGDYSCSNCSNASDIDEDYRYITPICEDKQKIWKNGKHKYPTSAYGNPKNFCKYMAHCTQPGESAYEFTDMNANKFLPAACSDFVGDSQNLPYPVTVADLSMSGAIKTIIKGTGVSIGRGTLSDLYSAIDDMDNSQLVEAYVKIIANKALLNTALVLTTGALSGNVYVMLSTAALNAADDIETIIENNGSNAKNILKGIVKSLVSKPLIEGIDFSLGQYRGFTAPMTQCIKETLSNMFLNKAGQSICKDSSEGINDEGLCGNDTFGPPESIREDAYTQIIGEQLSSDENIFYKIQSRLQIIIKLFAILAIFIIGLKFLLKGELDIFENIKKPKEIILGLLKFAIVFYFAVGNGWQSKFYDWLDKSTQYVYSESFNKSVVDYKDYRTINETYDDGTVKSYKYSSTYDGCYFGDNVYPEGKSYLAIFDTLDCKMMNYFGYGPEVTLPGIIAVVLLSMFFSPFAVVFVLLSFILFILLLGIVLKIFYVFLLSNIGINLLVYLSPIIFPTLLFDSHKSIFDKWVKNLISFSLQLVIVVGFCGVLITALDKFAIGSAQYINHDKDTGRLPTLVCDNAPDSIACIFDFDLSTSTKPLLGEKIKKFIGIGPIIYSGTAIIQDQFIKAITLLKFVLVLYVLYSFLNKISIVISELTGGSPLLGDDIGIKNTISKIKQGVELTGRVGRGVLTKGVGASKFGSLGKGATDKLSGVARKKIGGFAGKITNTAKNKITQSAKANALKNNIKKGATAANKLAGDVTLGVADKTGITKASNTTGKVTSKIATFAKKLYDKGDQNDN